MPKTTPWIAASVFILFSLLPVAAQKPLLQATEAYQEGELALLEGKVDKAIRLFNKALRNKPDLRAAQRGLGVCFELKKQYPIALQYYLSVLENNPRFSRALYYQTAKIYYKLGEYQQAIYYYDKFAALLDVPDTEFTVNGEKEQQLETEMELELPGAIRACQISIDSAKFQTDITVRLLGDVINSRYDEYFPFLSNDQSLLFFTHRRGREDENLYLTYFEADKGRWAKAGPVSDEFNTKRNEGMCTMVRDGRRMFFTVCNREEVMGPCDIWEARVEGTRIYDIQPLKGFSNSQGWESQAAISCDGSTLYFASTRPGGLGGTDIWYSKKGEDGRWQEPVNLGPKINTPEDEESPFITNDGKTLYFCSTGHPGLGDSDIFMSFLDYDGSWSAPVNLGPKVNTAYRELGFFLSADGKTGYYASDRPGGYGGMDIYQLILSEELYSEPVTFVEAYVRDSITQQGLESIVHISGREKLRTEPDGRFFLCLPALSYLDIYIDRTMYRPFDRSFDIPLWDNRKFYRLNLDLVPTYIPEDIIEQPEADTTPVVAPPSRIRVTRRYYHTIFFEFDSDETEPGELEKLDKFISDITAKEIQRVEINGYADDIGEDKYNLVLSEKRAKRIALHLIRNGVPVSRIAMKGHGEIADDRPKSQNRKVELKIFTID